MIELQIYHLEKHGRNEVSYKFYPDVLHTFSITWAWKLKLLQGM